MRWMPSIEHSILLAFCSMWNWMCAGVCYTFTHSDRIFKWEKRKIFWLSARWFSSLEGAIFCVPFTGCWMFCLQRKIIISPSMYSFPCTMENIYKNKSQANGNNMNYLKTELFMLIIFTGRRKKKRTKTITSGLRYQCKYTIKKMSNNLSNIRLWFSVHETCQLFTIWISNYMMFLSVFVHFLCLIRFECGCSDCVQGPLLRGCLFKQKTGQFIYFSYLNS